MHLEVGKTYINGQGELVSIKQYIEGRNYPFMDSNGATYRIDGVCWPHPNKLNLVKEVTIRGNPNKTTEELIADHKATLAALEARLVEEKKKEENIWGLFSAQQRDRFFFLRQERSNGFKTGYVDDGAGAIPTKSPVFNDYAKAQDFADAIQVMLELRMQPGHVKATIDGVMQWTISLKNDSLTYEAVVYTSNKAFAGAFETAISAEQAITVVGYARIKKAIETLAGC